MHTEEFFHLDQTCKAGALIGFFASFALNNEDSKKRQVVCVSVNITDQDMMSDFIWVIMRSR